MKRCYFTNFIELSGNLEMPYSCVQKKRKENFYNIRKLPLNLTVQNLWEHMLSRFVFEKNIFIHLHVYKHLNLNFISDFVTCLCSDSHCDLHTHSQDVQEKAEVEELKILSSFYGDQNLQHSDFSFELF